MVRCTDSSFAFDSERVDLTRWFTSRDLARSAPVKDLSYDEFNGMTDDDATDVNGRDCGFVQRTEDSDGDAQYDLYIPRVCTLISDQDLENRFKVFNEKLKKNYLDRLIGAKPEVLVQALKTGKENLETTRRARAFASSPISVSGEYDLHEWRNDQVTLAVQARGRYLVDEDEEVDEAVKWVITLTLENKGDSYEGRWEAGKWSLKVGPCGTIRGAWLKHASFEPKYPVFVGSSLLEGARLFIPKDQVTSKEDISEGCSCSQMGPVQRSPAAIYYKLKDAIGGALESDQGKKLSHDHQKLLRHIMENLERLAQPDVYKDQKELQF